MIQISQIKTGIKKQFHAEEELSVLKKQAYKKILEGIRKKKLTLRISLDEIKRFEIVKKSIDARKKEQIQYSYTVRLSLKKETERIVLGAGIPGISSAAYTSYRYMPSGEKTLSHPPIIVGMGPCGLFLGLMLAEAGYAPILLEQGGDVDERIQAVDHFWKTGVLDPLCNVQFGEGGAGTFSDGKLNTMVKDTIGRNRLVLETFVKYGAPSDILYTNKPHIGTDLLRGIVKNMRRRMQELGATVLFHTKLTDIQIENGHIVSVTAGEKQFPCGVLALAVGHSARTVFSLLQQKGVLMEAKPFAIGVRVEHPQELINRAQYGGASSLLPAADYKLTYQSSNGRSIYSFCMCPGGYVVNASSEEKRLVVNGMSNRARNGRNANSALIVTVVPEDFTLYGNGVLAGVQFQRHWEELAYRSGGGGVPVQLYGDLREGKCSQNFGLVQPDTRGHNTFADLRECLPEYVINTILEGMQAFGKKISNFDIPDAVFSGVETRTSSPVRILRGENFQGSIAGLYPCGEGAGYAGGITSAAMDGIRIYEAITSEYRRL